MQPSCQFQAVEISQKYYLLVLSTCVVFSLQRAFSWPPYRTYSRRTQQAVVRPRPLRTSNTRCRNYFLNIPDNYDQNKPYRLVFTWHQLGSSAQSIVNGEDIKNNGVLPYYGVKAIANSSAIFVVPDGINNGWANQGGEDVTFFDH